MLPSDNLSCSLLFTKLTIEVLSKGQKFTTFWDCSEEVAQVISTWEMLSCPCEHNHLTGKRVASSFVLIQPWLLGQQQLPSADGWVRQTFQHQEHFSSQAVAGWLSAHPFDHLSPLCPTLSKLKSVCPEASVLLSLTVVHILYLALSCIC